MESEYLSEANGKLATVRYSFSGEVPEPVGAVLQKHGYGDAHCLSGLALERLVLQPGVKLQVLAECADGWLHVTVPGCGLSRWINPEGVFGYIRTEVE